MSKMLAVIEPATEAVLEEIPRAGVEQVDEAVARARAAFPAWRDLAPGDRAARQAGPVFRGTQAYLTHAT